MRIWSLAALLFAVGLTLLIASGRERIDAIGRRFFLSGPPDTQDGWVLLVNTAQDVGMEPVAGGIVVAGNLEEYAVLEDGRLVARTNAGGSEKWLVVTPEAPQLVSGEYNSFSEASAALDAEGMATPVMTPVPHGIAARDPALFWSGLGCLAMAALVGIIAFSRRRGFAAAHSADSR